MKFSRADIQTRHLYHYTPIYITTCCRQALTLFDIYQIASLYYFYFTDGTSNDFMLIECCIVYRVWNIKYCIILNIQPYLYQKGFTIILCKNQTDFRLWFCENIQNKFHFIKYNDCRNTLILFFWGFHLKETSCDDLKVYYEIVGESRPLSGFFSPNMLICLQKCISNHETISNPPSFSAIRALIASQSMFEI